MKQHVIGVLAVGLLAASAFGQEPKPPREVRPVPAEKAPPPAPPDQPPAHKPPDMANAAPGQIGRAHV